MRLSPDPECVVLVDENNNVTGTMEKLEAHQMGRLHRAFSVMLYNDQGDMLLQKRAQSKYHTPGLWTNACCSHPRTQESILDAASRRLWEELGLQIPPTALKLGDAFVYCATFENGLTEHEYDTMVFGGYNGSVPFNTNEVDEVKWISPEALRVWVTREPEVFTPWFREILKRL